MPSQLRVTVRCPIFRDEITASLEGDPCALCAAVAAEAAAAGLTPPSIDTAASIEIAEEMTVSTELVAGGP